MPQINMLKYFRILRARYSIANFDPTQCGIAQDYDPAISHSAGSTYTLYLKNSAFAANRGINTNVLISPKLETKYENILEHETGA
jgi:hypothetical protein